MTIQLQGVNVLNNPAAFTDEFKFQITFDCVSPGVKEELEWKLVYVGSADNEHNDQELDSILVGPVRVGKNRFTFTAPPPDPTVIPKSDLLDVTVILLTCLYKEQEFIRIGYYVHNEYQDDIDQNDENIVIKPEKIIRNILADKPRVTRFNIKWDETADSQKQDQCIKAIGKENRFRQNDETKDNDQQYDEDEEEVDLDDLDEDDEEEEEEEDDDDEDQDIEEDLVETEEEEINNKNNNNHNQNTNNNHNNEDDGDDEDIDMN